MSNDTSRALVAAVLGLVSAGVLALLNNWINARAGIDENLRTHRLENYPDLWASTAAVSRWPRSTVHRWNLDDLHRTLRSWYYGKGGLFLSEQSRARYGDLQELIAAVVTAHEHGAAIDVLAPDAYTDLMETASALRTALTEDLDTRRRRSALEKFRRARWHTDATQAAKARISRAKAASGTAIWQPEAD